MPDYFEQATALFEQGNYEAAKEAFEAAIEENEEDARAWNGLGNACLRAGEHEEAYEAFEQAVAWDESFAPAWHGLGLALERLEQYPKALEALQQAIRLNRESAEAWNSLGGLYINRLGRPEEGIRCFQRLEFLSQGRFAANLFALFSQLPNYPFFSWRIIQAYMPMADYGNWGGYIRQTMQDAGPLLACQHELSLRRQAGELSEAQWLLWAGLASLMMGDPATALGYLNRCQPLQPEPSLLAAYYQLQACWDFHEPDTEYLRPARERAAAFLPREQDSGWQFWKKKKEPSSPALPPEDYEDCYYAGMIFAYNGELEEAMKCFERIESDFLPAAYQALWLCEEMVQPKKKKEKAALVLSMEAKQRQFTGGIQPVNLSAKAPDPLAVLMPVVRYQELADAIEVLHLFTEFEGNPHDFEVLNPREQPPFHQLWTMSPEEEQRILNLLREENKRLAPESLAGAGAPPAEAWPALEQLARARPFDRQQFFSLLMFLNVEKKLTEYETIMAGLFGALVPENQEGELREAEAEDAGAGAAESPKPTLAGNLSVLDAGLGWPGLLHSYENRAAAGALAELAAQWLQEPGTQISSLQAFREQLEAFIETKKTEAGDSFEEKHPALLAWMAGR